MRTSPAINVVLARFGVWRTAIALLAAAALGAIWAWWSTWGTEQPQNTGYTLLAAVVLASGAVIALAALLASVKPTALRWDGQVWWMQRVKRGLAAGREAVAGEIVVAIDLGMWMLLRFEPAIRGAWLRCVWLPVQRGGIETEWHALRCALYSPKPAPNADGASTEQAPP